MRRGEWLFSVLLLSSSSVAVGATYSIGLAKDLSKQGQIVSIARVIREGTSDHERKMCEQEQLSDGAVRQYLSLAMDADVDAHEFAAYSCSFHVVIRFNQTDWLLNLNVSGLGYIRSGEEEWHVLGCGHACSAFLPSAESDSDLCASDIDGC